MPHIIGTAGHIDHGKTALIRALTGQDTDRLKEEKERGISIDLGFAYMELANGERAGIVDVPGHERFIRNMLAGAHGIDLVLLVVAADDGVMPQTEEHLDILHLLGATHGVVAITKADLVDEARLAEVREEVEILLAGSALQDAPIVAVSSITGAGLEPLRQVIEARLATYQRSAPTGYLRLPVDRAFIMHGHGTVVTGTAIAGSVRPGDLVRVLPGGEEVRVRSVQVHGREVSAATHGQRVAVNLAGVERTVVTRGHVVCDPRLERVTDRLDAWVELRPAAGRQTAARTVKSHDNVRLHLGTAEVIAKLVLLDDRDALLPGHCGYAQLVLRTPVQAVRGDRFVLRNQTAQITIGGGMVVHPFARRHQRGGVPLPLLEALHHAVDAGVVVRALLQIEPDFAVAPEFIAQAAGLSSDAIRDALCSDPAILGLPNRDTPAACTTAEKWRALRSAVIEALTTFHQQVPLAAGVEMESLRSQLAPDVSSKIFRAVLDALLAEGVIARQDSLMRLPTHRTALQQGDVQLASRVESILVDARFTPPDLKVIEGSLAVPRPRLQTILHQLEREGRVTKIIEGLYFARQPLEHARALLREHTALHGDIDAATFRTLLGASRKFSIALLDYFDRTGFTLRVGDIRKLRAPSGTTARDRLPSSDSGSVEKLDRVPLDTPPKKGSG